MICPSCGSAELVPGVQDMPYSYKGETMILPDVAGDYCPACGEAVLDAETSARTMQLMAAFAKSINATIVDPAYIAAVRTKLRLGQREAGEIFGGGVNAFSRYETGKTRPSVALVKLLRLLDRHPELLAELQ